MKRSVPPLDPATWDFSSCPKNQVRLCLYYEFARNSEAVTEYLASDTYKNSPITTSLGSRYIAFVCPEFPATPWLGLSEDVREERAKSAELADFQRSCEEGLVIPNGGIREFLEALAADIGDLDRHPPDIVGTRFDLLVGVRRVPQRNVTWVAMQLDWSKSKKSLIRDFRHWIQKQPKDFARNVTGRCNHRDLLNGLGALRLRDYCKQQDMPRPIEEALRIWQEHAPNAVPYNDGSAARRAIRRTKKELTKLYKHELSSDAPTSGLGNAGILLIRDI